MNWLMSGLIGPNTPPRVICRALKVGFQLSWLSSTMRWAKSWTLSCAWSFGLFSHISRAASAVSTRGIISEYRPMACAQPRTLPSALSGSPRSARIASWYEPWLNAPMASIRIRNSTSRFGRPAFRRSASRMPNRSPSVPPATARSTSNVRLVTPAIAFAAFM